MWILISWLLQKPADLDLHCLQEKPADQDPNCLQEFVYIWFHTVFERINFLSTLRYKLIFSFGQVKFSMDKYIWLFACPWTSRIFFYFHTPVWCLSCCLFYWKMNVRFQNQCKKWRFFDLQYISCSNDFESCMLFSYLLHCAAATCSKIVFKTWLVQCTAECKEICHCLFQHFLENEMSKSPPYIVRKCVFKNNIFASH